MLEASLICRRCNAITDVTDGLSMSRRLQGGTKKWGHYTFEGSHLLLKSSKRLNQFSCFLAHFNAVLFWTHLLIPNSSNLSYTVAQPGKS